MKNIRLKRKGFRLLAIALIVFLSNLTIVAQVVIQRCDVTTGWTGDAAFSWPLDKSHVINGWNLLQLQISLAGQSGGGANLGSINFIQISQNLSGPITAKIDFTLVCPRGRRTFLARPGCS